MPSIFTLSGPKLDGQRGMNFQPQIISDNPLEGRGVTNFHGQRGMNFEPRILRSSLGDAATTSALTNLLLGIGLAAAGIFGWNYYQDHYAGSTPSKPVSGSRYHRRRR